MMEIEKREDQACNGNHVSASVTANSIAPGKATTP